jgi:hypothetical protein
LLLDDLTETVVVVCGGGCGVAHPGQPAGAVGARIVAVAGVPLCSSAELIISVR